MIPFYGVLETSRPEDLEHTNISSEELQQQINKPILTEHNKSVYCLSEITIKGIEEKKRQITKQYEEELQTLMINNIKEDLRKRDKREFALILLIETFGDFIHDHKFISWLSPRLGHYPGR